ncbi:glycosyltransferase involved in cell wall biosynthesis [Cellulophaga sp. RHA_52]|uniref:glycosyltransferase family 4 protein n=1 Tax=Cellulophaga sp. RHA_52 TaxID=1250036 RepID=UPI00119BD3AA|nr:glycosyltransferase family 4 protein [Cellulophaga sp. RHA_52]TVZ10236.1 glycosyltransferase involved in cell wall biosynthesis [Cellulophaga sp. RHA_52]
MPKLVYITNGVSGPGGLERVLSIKASYFADAMQYNVHIIALNNDSSDLFYNFSKAITFHNVKATGNPFSYLNQYKEGLKNCLNKINPDIVSVCDDGLKGLLLPYIIGKPCPMIYERHVSKNIQIKKGASSFLGQLKNKITFKLMDLGAAKYNSFVVLTNGNTKEWQLKNMSVIANPLSFFPEEKNLSLLNTKKVLAVGKQSYQKGYDRLLQSWKTVAEKHPDWELDIYGTISEKEQLPKLAEELGITRSVHFYAPVKNIAEKYQEASIYVMSSRYEGFGMVLTEAMAYGVPCVSFDCPHGPADIITHNKNGVLVPNDDCDKLANGLLQLIGDDGNRQKMGTAARRDVQRYSIEKIAMKWDMLFKKIIRTT